MDRVIDEFACIPKIFDLRLFNWSGLYLLDDHKKKKLILSLIK